MRIAGGALRMLDDVSQPRAECGLLTERFTTKERLIYEVGNATALLNNMTGPA